MAGTYVQKKMKRNLWKVLNAQLRSPVPPTPRNPMPEECHHGSWFWKDVQLESVWRIYWRGGKETKGERPAKGALAIGQGY